MSSTQAGPSVLHVCDFGSPTAGNFVPSQHEVARLTRSELGLGTHFLFPELPGGNAFTADLEADGFSVTLLDRSQGKRRRALAIRDIAVRHRAVLLHSHFTGLDLECLWAARQVGAQTIWHLHSGSYRPAGRGQLTDLVKVRMLGRLCDRVVACAEWVGEQAIERGFPPSKVRVVENAIDLDRFSDGALVPKADARQRFGLPVDATILLGFGWDPHRKGVDLMLEAGRELARRHPGDPPRTVIVGTDALGTYIDERVGPDRPHWLTLLEPVEDVAALLSAADCFVNASRAEGLPYAIGEAMAARLPVVASDISGSRFYLPAAGLTSFADGDSADLVRALEEVLGTADLSVAGSQNREFAFANLALERYAREMLGVYRELPAVRRDRPRDDSE